MGVLVEHRLEAAIRAVAHHLAPIGVLARGATGAQKRGGLRRVEHTAERPRDPRSRKSRVERGGREARDASKRPQRERPGASDRKPGDGLEQVVGARTERWIERAVHRSARELHVLEPATLLRRRALVSVRPLRGQVGVRPPGVVGVEHEWCGPVPAYVAVAFTLSRRKAIQQRGDLLSRPAVQVADGLPGWAVANARGSASQRARATGRETRELAYRCAVH